MSKRFGTALTTALALTAAVATAAAAETPAEFFKGRTVAIYVGLSPGGLYSTFAQILANHYGRHIPGNPTVIVKHLPGAGGQRALNFVYNAAPKDGTVLVTPNGGIAKNIVLERGQPKYDPLKFQYLGGWGEPVTVLSVFKTAPATTMEEATKKEVILGAISKSSNTYILPKIYNEMLGTKFKIIAGYRGGARVRLAMEKGEVQGWSGQWLGWKTRKPEWIAQDKLAHLVQLASKRSPDLPDVPLLTEFAKNENQRRIFEFLQSSLADRSIAAPPGVPADRVAALSKAYLATLDDPKFRAETDKRKFTIDPVTPDQIQVYLKKILDTPPDLIAKIKSMMEVSS